MTATRSDSAAAEPSTSGFAGIYLSPATVAGLNRQGITEPTPIQSSAIPLLLAGRDVIGQAKTGSGKTLAFVLPAIELLDPNLAAIQMMVLTPTRELAVQIASVADPLGTPRGLSSVTVVGGRSDKPQKAAIRRGAQILIGTPGRVLDLVNQGALRLDRLRFLVLDEADNLLDKGFGPDVGRIIRHMPDDRQTALFSATMPSWVVDAARRYMKNPETVSLDVRPEDAAPVDHYAVDLVDNDKMRVLREILDCRGAGSTIVFGRTKHGVRKLARKLERDGYPVAALQGNLSQNARDRVMSNFRAGEIDILVATNVAARGLDITDVNLVINVDLPESSELLTHRIGRTGRMGRSGQAITLLSPDDIGKWRKLRRRASSDITRLPWSSAGELLGASPAPSRPEPVAAVVPSPVSEPSRPRAQRRQYEIACSSCGESDTVPFEPDPSRPVFCSACYTPGGRRSRRRRR